MGGLFYYHFKVCAVCRITRSFSFIYLNIHSARVLGLVSIHNPTMPLHIASMYHLQHLHSKLFMLAHEMVDREPENPISWYAVGVWYLSGGKWHQARQYFRCDVNVILVTLLTPRVAKLR